MLPSVRDDSSVSGEREMLPSSLKSGYGSVFFGIKIPKEEMPTTRMRLSNPPLRSFVPGDASELGRRSFDRSNILGVSIATDDAKVASAVVKPVAVDVVNFTLVTARQTHYAAMKQAASFFIGASSVPVRPQRPSELIDPFSIHCIHDGVRADFISTRAKRNARGLSIGQDFNGRERVFTLTRAKHALIRLRRGANDDCAARFTWARGALGTRLVLAGARTHLAAPSRNQLSGGENVFSADKAGARNGILIGHRVSPTLGVMPPAGNDCAGVSCVNFTTLSKEAA